MQLSPRARLGPYEIISALGAGGMGEVYRARDLRLDREVALKIVPAELAGMRFHNEAKAIAALSHPNIVNVFDVGADAGLSYMAVELLEGEDLRSILSGGRIPWKRAIKIASAISDALRYAHGKGIIHRDLKPENVFITREGLTKVLDFGLARVMPSEAAGSAEAAQTLTRPGMVMGTVGYMSPEQVRGESVTPSSDIFSLGCVLYEMLSGVQPFERGSAGEVLAAILRDPPRDLREISDAPESLIRIVEHCLEKEPWKRFDTMSDFAFALESVTEGVPARTLFVRGAILIVIAAVVIIVGRRGSTVPTPPAHREISSLAVMPFVNASADRSYDYLSDGLTEAIINDLSPIAGFKVMSRSSVFAYKPKVVDPRELGNDLGVDAVVNGRVIRRDGSLLVSVELVDTRDGHQIWGERYDRPISQLRDLERDLAGSISQKLKMRLTKQPVSVDPEAYRLYLQGRYEWNKRTPEGLRKGVEFFKRAIDIDPTYAPAYAGVADSYLLLGGNYEVLRPSEVMPMAREAALKAVSLDDSLAEPHASLGLIKHEFEWNWPDAEAEFKRAIALNPNYAVGHEWYGQALLYRSRSDEAFRELQRAEELDPLSLVSKADLAQAFWITRQYDKAIEESLKSVEIEPRFWLAHWFLGLAYAGKEDYANAAKSLETAVSLGGSPAASGSLGYVYAKMGRRKDAERLLRQLGEESKKRYISPAPFVAIYIGLGDLDHAFEEMERAFRERSSLITVINVVPIADAVRRDPRYAAFARRVGLPPLP
ncbi:MAG TPA: protein kinase [Thermoanaerobaculia bacterium]|jgi:serine/threonine-protein kinase|nr:protein kinase [Thermoanaerobaculia bacterium]